MRGCWGGGGGAGEHTHDRAPVTPPAAPPHIEVVVLALAACAAVALVGRAGHHEKVSAVRLQGPWQMEFNECEAVVVGHDGFRVQVRVTQGPQHTIGREIRVKRTNVVRVEKPTTNMATVPSQAPADGDRTANGPRHQRKGPGRGHATHTARELVSWHQVLGVRYPGATTEERCTRTKTHTTRRRPRDFSNK